MGDNHRVRLLQSPVLSNLLPVPGQTLVETIRSDWIQHGVETRLTFPAFPLTKSMY